MRVERVKLFEYFEKEAQVFKGKKNAEAAHHEGRYHHCTHD